MSHVNTQLAPPKPTWAAVLARDDQNQEREVELFYAHLAWGLLEGDPVDFLGNLIESLPLSESTRLHLRNQEPARLLVYRSLVRETLRKTLAAAMPRTIARLGASFDGIFDLFLVHNGSQAHCLRELTSEFIEFFTETEFAAISPFLVELAELEAASMQVAASPNLHSKLTTTREDSPDLSRGLVFLPATRTLNFRYAIHQLPLEQEDRSEPVECPTHLLAYRDFDNDVRHLELSPLAAQMIDLLILGQNLGAAITAACEEQNEPISPAVLEGCARVLSELAARGVVLGASG